MNLKPGMKVRHKRESHTALYGILNKSLIDGKYWSLDIYYENGDIYRDGNWATTNILPYELNNNKEASILLEKEM